MAPTVAVECIYFRQYLRKVEIHCFKRFPDGTKWLLRDALDASRPPLLLTATKEKSLFYYVDGEWPPDGWSASHDVVLPGAALPVNRFCGFSARVTKDFKQILSGKENLYFLKSANLNGEHVDASVRAVNGQVILSWRGMTEADRCVLGNDRERARRIRAIGPNSLLEIVVWMSSKTKTCGINVILNGETICSAQCPTRKEGSWCEDSCVFSTETKLLYTEVMDDFSYLPKEDSYLQGSFVLSPED